MRLKDFDSPSYFYFFTTRPFFTQRTEYVHVTKYLSDINYNLNGEVAENEMVK